MVRATLGKWLHAFEPLTSLTSAATTKNSRMNYELFTDALFEVADVWCDEIDEKEYVTLIGPLIASCRTPKFHKKRTASAGMWIFWRPCLPKLR